MTEESGVSRTPRTWTHMQPGWRDYGDCQQVRDNEGGIWTRQPSDLWTKRWKGTFGWLRILAEYGPLVEVLPDAPEPQPEEVQAISEEWTPHTSIAVGIKRGLADFGAELVGCSPAALTGHVLAQLREAGFQVADSSAGGSSVSSLFDGTTGPKASVSEALSQPAASGWRERAKARLASLSPEARRELDEWWAEAEAEADDTTRPNKPATEELREPALIAKEMSRIVFGELNRFACPPRQFVDQYGDRAVGVRDGAIVICNALLSAGWRPPRPAPKLPIIDHKTEGGMCCNGKRGCGGPGSYCCSQTVYFHSHADGSRGPSAALSGVELRDAEERDNTAGGQL